ncbi:hypothetical protein QYM36_010914 [Artemia franciscana]|uniref:Uncharacterized protein n=1 Tax=Artemia franciscana TaxID=6661 RepID=A0AA88HN93_ARTSF|nr:hypothetical protein QYM36_010914 [Artemia franciscana]
MRFILDFFSNEYGLQQVAITNIRHLVSPNSSQNESDPRKTSVIFRVNAADLQARVDKTPEPLEPAITDVRGLDIKIKDTVKQSFSEFEEELKKDIDVKFMDIETRVSKLEQTSSTAADPALLQKPIDCR